MKKLLCALLAALVILTCTAAVADDPFSGMLYYYEGQYYVGRDMQAGEYVLLATTDYAGYFCISSDANQNNIIQNGIFDVNSIITVQYGEYMELSRCIAVRSSDFYSQYSIKTENYGTMLKVGYGYDITPGTYRLVCDNSGYDGYYCIYNSSRQDHIVANDLFSNSAYVTVTSGQYLELSRCRIVG